MNELVKALGRFIRRDLIFIFGGASVIVSFLCYYGRWDTIPKIPEPSILWIVFGIGIAYFVGYVIQDGSSLTPFVTTVTWFKPNCLIKWLYKRFTRKDWEDVEKFDQVDMVIWINDQEKVIPKRTFDAIERIITFKMIGMTLGPSWFISGVFLLLYSCGKGTECLVVKIAISVLIVSIVLLLLGWIKAAQQLEFYSKLKSNLENKRK